METKQQDVPCDRIALSRRLSLSLCSVAKSSEPSSLQIQTLKTDWLGNSWKLTVGNWKSWPAFQPHGIVCV